MTSPDTLLSKARNSKTSLERRSAFVELVRSPHWQLALTPDVIVRQGYGAGNMRYPDLNAFSLVANAIAADNDRVRCCLELVGTRFSSALLNALAHEMKGALIEPALTALWNAHDIRAPLLLQVLQEADPTWVDHPLAMPLIIRQLRIQDHSRAELLSWLADAGQLERYVDVLLEFPPETPEEWSALGQHQMRDQRLFDLAMAILPKNPASACYLLRLDPMPTVVAIRMISSARRPWIISLFELLMIDGVQHDLLVSIADIGARMGGRSSATVAAWIGASKLSERLLIMADEAIQDRNNSHRSVKDAIWARKNRPQGERALEHARRGKTPSPMDIGHLVRQMRGIKMRDVINEILECPHATMFEYILHPLVAVNEDAAWEILRHCKSKNKQVAQRAQRAREWTDVIWPRTTTVQPPLR